MRAKTALLVIDVQVGMFPEDYPVHDGDALLSRVSDLIAKARKADVPVIYVQHNEAPEEPLATGTEGWRVHPAVAPIEGEPAIQKFRPDAFAETDLSQELERLGSERLVIAGLQTDCCIAATSRRAAELGYEVTIVSDAHSTWGQGSKSAQEIIDQHNDEFKTFAALLRSEQIAFPLV